MGFLDEALANTAGIMNVAGPVLGWGVSQGHPREGWNHELTEDATRSSGGTIVSAGAGPEQWTGYTSTGEGDSRDPAKDVIPDVIPHSQKELDKEMMKIERFKSHFSSFSSPARYIVEFYPYISRKKDSSEILKKLSFACKQVEQPGKSYSTADRRIYGHLKRLPYDIIITETTMSFINDQTYDVRQFFVDWLEYIQNQKTKNYKYYNDYIGTCKVRPIADGKELNWGGHIVQELAPYINIEEIYPTAVGPIAMGYDMTDQIQEFSVTFTYKNWIFTDATKEAAEKNRKIVSSLVDNRNEDSCDNIDDDDEYYACMDKKENWSTVHTKPLNQGEFSNEDLGQREKAYMDGRFEGQDTKYGRDDWRRYIT